MLLFFSCFGFLRMAVLKSEYKYFIIQDERNIRLGAIKKGTMRSMIPLKN
jgi:hypothetical protein